MAEGVFTGRVGLQQRVLPAYRAPFFDRLAEACTGGLSVFAGAPRRDEAIRTASRLDTATLHPARNLHFLSPSHPLYLCWQAGILRWLKRWDPDVLVVEANPRYPATRLAVRWMRARGRPVIGWGLGAPPPAGSLAPLRRRGRASFLRRFDALIAYSQRGAEAYRALGFPPQRVYVAPNAAAPRPSAPPPERPPAFSGRPTVLFVGRLQTRKRIDLLLRACASLPSPLQPRLWVIGEGPAQADLQTLAERIYTRAEFPGAVHGAELAPYFAGADLFVLPGTGGLAVQEAMAYGLPVIVAQGDGTQEDLVRAGNGWLVPPDDLPALTETLREALSDPARLRRMGVESYRIVAEESNVESMVGVFVRALNEATGAPPG